MDLIQLPELLMGIIFLFSGRKMFWLFITLIGITVGLGHALAFFPDAQPWMIIAGSIGFSLIGAFAAILCQWLAVILAGFLGGGYFLTGLVASGVFPAGLQFEIVFLIGGIIGMIFLSITFNWALIILSSLLGAWLILPIFPTTGPINSVIFMLCAAIGCVIQTTVLLNEGDKRPAK